MASKKLNFGCGRRFSDDWTNIDFHSNDSRVRRVNLLAGFPFSDGVFEAVYSSHVLEHFDRKQGKFILQESFRTLRKGGILRVVVPDLEGSCLEYLRVLNLPDGFEKRMMYEWIIIELVDQMVRNNPSGAMGKFMSEVSQKNNRWLLDYVRSRTENTEPALRNDFDNPSRVKNITLQKLITKISYFYIKIISRLVPSSLRSMVFVQTSIGERHLWMYDEYGLKVLLEEVGFSEVRRVEYNESAIANFNLYCLDCNPDGQPYKNNSVYMEGVK